MLIFKNLIGILFTLGLHFYYMCAVEEGMRENVDLVVVIEKVCDNKENWKNNVYDLRVRFEFFLFLKIYYINLLDLFVCFHFKIYSFY